MHQMTPYEALQAERAARRQTPVTGRPPRLNDYQRAQRIKANNLARRRAQEVLQQRYHAEFLALQKVERNALYALIDAEAASGGSRDLYEIAEG